MSYLEKMSISMKENLIILKSCFILLDCSIYQEGKLNNRLPKTYLFNNFYMKNNAML